MLTARQLARLLNSQSSIVPINACNWSPRIRDPNRSPVRTDAQERLEGGRKGGREGQGTVCPWFHGLQGGWKDWSGEGLLGWVWHPCGPCLPALLKYSPGVWLAS